MLKTYRTLRIAGMGGAAVAAFTAQPALAQTATGTIGVSAEVTASCTFTTTAVNFASVNPASATPDDAEGALSVNCTNGTTWSATADAGGTAGATRTARKMTNGGTGELTYSLYTNTARNSLWGDGATDGIALAGTGTGSAVSTAVYGRVPASQAAVPAGTYTDTVNVTLTY